MVIEYNLSIILTSPEAVAKEAELLAEIIQQLQGQTELPQDEKVVAKGEKTSTTSADVMSVTKLTETTVDKKRDAVTP